MLRMVGSHASKLVLACSVFLASVTGPILVHAKGPLRSDSQAAIQVAELPRQGQETYRLIRQGGPFPYEKDGTVFGNRERLLPPQKRGYYREYTVQTPGSRDRGARRIVCGGKPKAPDVCFYTSDHYASFRKVEE
jgi:ribonuclease T1